MGNGECKVGMRVAWTAKAKRTPGIGLGIRGEKRHDIPGEVIEMGKNHLGSDLAHVRWDDGWVSDVSVYWIKREWAVGGYRPSKHDKRELGN